MARALAILMQVAASPEGLTTREIAERLGLSLPTTYHLVHTLTTEGFLTKGERRAYRLGLQIGTLAQAFSKQLEPSEHLKPYLRSLAARTGEAAYVAGWQEGEIVILSRVPGHHAVSVTDLRVGTVGNAHARASGKLLLAFASADVRAEYLRSHPPERRTPRTLTDVDDMNREFEKIREQGYATDTEEFLPGVCCLAVPLDAGTSPFVFSLSAPSERFARNLDSYLAVALEIAQAASSTGLPPIPTTSRGGG